MQETHVLKWVNALGGLLDLTTNNLWDELGKLGESAARSLALDDLSHLLADSTNLGALGVGGLLDLVWSSLGEGNGEKTDEVVIGGLDGDIGFDEGLPFANKRSELVRCEVQSVEVGQAVLSLYFIDT